MSGDAAPVRRPATGTHDEVPTSRPDTGRGHSPRTDGQGAPATHSAHDESVVRGLMFSSMNSRAAKLDDAPEAERFAKNPQRKLESDVSRELQTGVPGTFGCGTCGPAKHCMLDPIRIGTMPATTPRPRHSAGKKPFRDTHWPGPTWIAPCSIPVHTPTGSLIKAAAPS